MKALLIPAVSHHDILDYTIDYKLQPKAAFVTVSHRNSTFTLSLFSAKLRDDQVITAKSAKHACLAYNAALLDWMYESRNVAFVR